MSNGVCNIVGVAMQIVAGVSLGAAFGWRDLGAIAVGFLIGNQTATAMHGVGEIVNHTTNSNGMREDYIVRTGAKADGRAIGGNAVAKIADGENGAPVLSAYMQIKWGYRKRGSCQ